ncbi:tRNA (adenosine(37)-N6)-dimethylallyltransferase MiaA [Effusibacillus pohliae]|uniref:tRNA (adenosine(37)-N6)-dimethylallyltransferase MiaA n=1 Tax=Effusibacillus pohliae TaxID=232270 RepID=UPI00036D53F4|nr:tRNA (adenosine(37)-N6)-dimethylallyltransferase MiaA [Effusibacillus pohliae]
MRQQNGLVMIVGPTAVGKTKLGVELAAAFQGEVISADSMQIYRGMDIGTAKITPEEMKGVPHWGIDIVDPDTPFSVANYRKLAEQWLEDIWRRGRLPFLVGGTGLYIRALTEEYHFVEFAGDPEFRKELEEAARVNGQEFLHERLRKVDPVTAGRLHPNDLRRIIRALEIYEYTGKRMSNVPPSKGATRFPTLKIGLTMQDRQLLYERINRRVDQMLAKGLVDEVQWLLANGIHSKLNSMQAIGYKEIIDYLEGRIPLAEAVEQIKRGSRRYAKRQLSWFRRDPNIRWFAVDRIAWNELYGACYRLVQEFQHQLANRVEIKEDGGSTS